MTIKLFESDVYLKEADCEIIDIIKDNNEIFLVLDQTIFYPEGGGQPSDLGMIGDCNIIKVSEKNNAILHKVDKMPSNKNVKCILNWDRRFDHMQQHCGEHILSGVILKYYGYHNMGFHLGDDYVTIDVDANELSDNIIKNIEIKANEEIYKDLNILITTVDTEKEAKSFPIRKMPDIDKNIRIVQINQVDCVACCGTHPLKTGEVGIIKIIKAIKYKGMTRIFFKCGKRALEYYQKEHEIISILNRKYSSELITLLERIEKENIKYNELKSILNNASKKLSKYEAIELINETNNNIISKIYNEENIEELDLISNIVFEKGEYIIILCSIKAMKIILAFNGKLEINCGEIFKKHISTYKGRGGGNKTKSQGSFLNKENMLEFYYFLNNYFKNMS